MKNSKKIISDIIFEGLLNGKLELLDKYLIEKSLNDENHIEEDISSEEKERVLEKLERVRQDRLGLKRKLENIQSISFLGDFLKCFLRYYKPDINEVIKKTGFDLETLKSIIKNTIDITKTNIKSLIRLIKYLKISYEDSEELIKNSCKLFIIDPTYKNAMARYKPGNDEFVKDKSMKDGFNELLMTANEFKPLKIKNNTINHKSNLSKFIEEYKKEFINE